MNKWEGPRGKKWDRGLYETRHVGDTSENNENNKAKFSFCLFLSLNPSSLTQIDVPDPRFSSHKRGLMLLTQRERERERERRERG